MATLQAILLAQEREQIQALRQHLQQLQNQVQVGIDSLERREQELEMALDAVRRLAQDNQFLSQQLQTEVTLLQRRARADSEGLIAKIAPLVS